MSFFAPEFEGQLTVDRLPDDFTARLQHRVEQGLLVPGKRKRANYKVRSMDGSAIRFSAEGFLTTYAVGLNDVTVCRSGRNQVQYQVTYWGWTMAAVAHGLLLGVVLVAGYLLVPEVARDLQKYSNGSATFLDMVVFWSLVWPWILSRIHRPFARHAIERILRETLVSTPEEHRRAA